MIEAFGVPLRYYVDSLRVFRFVQGRDSVWRKHVLQTDDVDTQWHNMMRILDVDVSFALSPQAKGKVERPYREPQDRIVRTGALEGLGLLIRDLFKGALDKVLPGLLHVAAQPLAEVIQRAQIEFAFPDILIPYGYINTCIGQRTRFFDLFSGYSLL